ncbi:hypothetical protein EYF80_048395 [Liparis tanakae]|uniref:Uncharacterized protein n=1 Tax=Liparis tanakae TaxID=230148 RepID=A0A4Z2FL01_9TELE|nr:hypothetical protein EYF80_048395 [Liparis tanakae]
MCFDTHGYTSISTLLEKESQKPAPLFDLQGVEVSSPALGGGLTNEKKDPKWEPVSPLSPSSSPLLVLPKVPPSLKAPHRVPDGVAVQVQSVPRSIRLTQDRASRPAL